MTNQPIPREMTASERRKIKKLVVDLCANYDKEYGCLPLDCDCYMLGKWYTGNFCKYFCNAVLPTNPVLEAALAHHRVNTKCCRVCGSTFPVKGRKVYCSEKCKEAGQKKETAARVRKHRQKWADR